MRITPKLRQGLRTYIDESGLTQMQIAEILDYSPSGISRIINGKLTRLGHDVGTKLLEKVMPYIDELPATDTPDGFKAIPIYPMINSIEIFESIVKWKEGNSPYSEIVVDKSSQAQIALLVDDNSAEPIVSEGDVIVVDHLAKVSPGELVLLVESDDCYIKRFDGDLPGGLSIFSDDMDSKSALKLETGSWLYCLKVIESRKYSFTRYKKRSKPNRL